MKKIKALIQGEEAQGMVEYILIVALVAVAAIAVIRIFGGKIQDLFKDTGNKLNSELEGTIGSGSD